MVQLPKFAALRSKYNNKYLRFVNEKSSPVRTFLQYSGEEILTPYTKLELEEAQSDSSLFHIKCCYNNKYWVSSPSDHHFIVATADQKQEDKSKWTCTLFRPTYDNNHQSFRFSHVFLGLTVVLWRADPPYGECLRPQWSTPDKDLCDLSLVFNWESFVSLPKFVAFRGDNENYLRHILRENNVPYLQFGGSFIDDPNIQMETYMTKDGSIRIKSSQGNFGDVTLLIIFLLTLRTPILKALILCFPQPKLVPLLLLYVTWAMETSSRDTSLITYKIFSMPKNQNLIHLPTYK